MSPTSFDGVSSRMCCLAVLALGGAVPVEFPVSVLEFCCTPTKKIKTANKKLKNGSVPHQNLPFQPKTPSPNEPNCSFKLK